jgi:hypothetical protein
VKREILMDIDIIGKLVVPALAATIAGALQMPAVRKAWDDLKHLRRDRKKRESEFAATFAKHCNDPNVASYAEELGYAALVGDKDLGLEERRFLLSLRDSERVIDRFVRTTHWIKVSLSEQRLAWKRRRHESLWYRRAARAAYLIGYLAGALFAGLPIIARGWFDPQSTAPPSLLVLLLAWTSMVGVPAAVLCMRRFFLLGEAAEVIASQQARETRALPSGSASMQVIQLTANDQRRPPPGR